jgi:CheY-like chemotaxis protein
MPGGTSILIVEDDSNVRDTIEDVLVDEGHTVSVARNGAEALATLKHAGRPTLILLDIWMPVMDGLSFLNALRARQDRDDFEVVVMSAALAPEWFVNAPGVVKALKKPFEVSEILTLSAEFAERRSSRGASAGAGKD